MLDPTKILALSSWQQEFVSRFLSEPRTKSLLHWWEIWNASRRARGLPDLDPKDRTSSHVWRVELRAGKEHLKNRWGIRTWTDLDTKLGDVLQTMLRAVRYTESTVDGNRSRWPNHPIWDVVARETAGDLFEMTSGADPMRVKAVCREHLQATLSSQIIGSSATLAVAYGMRGQDLAELPESVMVRLRRFMREQPDRFAEKLRRAEERYHFIDTADRSSPT